MHVYLIIDKTKEHPVLSVFEKEEDADSFLLDLKTRPAYVSAFKTMDWVCPHPVRIYDGPVDTESLLAASKAGLL